MVQGTGHLIPNQEIVGSIPAEGATTRISPVWEAVRKTAVGRFDPGPRLQRSVAQHGERGCPLSSRLRVRVPPDRPSRPEHENLTRVLTLWGSRRGLEELSHARVVPAHHTRSRVVSCRHG